MSRRDKVQEGPCFEDYLKVVEFKNEYELDFISIITLMRISGDCYRVELSGLIIDVQCVIEAIFRWLRDNPYSSDSVFNGNSPYQQTNDCEKDLTNSGAMEALCASQLATNWITANAGTRAVFGVNTSNECSDAYRHTFFNALNSLYCSEVLARQYGEARECSADSDLSRTMDLFNNERGYDILSSNADIGILMTSDFPNLFHQGITLLKDKICEELSNGNMLIYNIPRPTQQQIDNGEVFLIDSSSCNCD